MPNLAVNHPDLVFLFLIFMPRKFQLKIQNKFSLGFQWASSGLPVSYFEFSIENSQA
jgi:hypothetical protein